MIFIFDGFVWIGWYFFYFPFQSYQVLFLTERKISNSLQLPYLARHFLDSNLNWSKTFQIRFELDTWLITNVNKFCVRRWTMFSRSTNFIVKNDWKSRSFGINCCNRSRCGKQSRWSLAPKTWRQMSRRSFTTTTFVARSKWLHKILRLRKFWCPSSIVSWRSTLFCRTQSMWLARVSELIY